MTDKKFEKDINKYLKSIRKMLICDNGIKNKFINDLKNEIHEYVYNKATINIQEIYEHFGTPKKISESFLQNTDIQNINKKIKLRKVFIVVCVLFLIFVGVSLAIALIDGHSSNNGYIVENITNTRSLNHFFN